jgi:hypothetical protein
MLRSQRDRREAVPRDQNILKNGALEFIVVGDQPPTIWGGRNLVEY